MRVLFAVGALLLLGGCGLPAAGPTTNEVLSQAAEKGPSPFAVVAIDENVIRVHQTYKEPTFHSAFGKDGIPASPRIQVGDSVAISIWETGGGGLTQPEATASAGTRLTTPPQVVERDGKISVPYDGRVQAAGRTTLALQTQIRASLESKLMDPQIIVTVQPSIANSVTVAGGAVKGSFVPISPYGMRLLDVIAAAGGYQGQVYETSAKLTRHGKTLTIPMRTLIDDPSENIYAWPGDTLSLVQTTRTFDVFGAAAKNAEIPFDTAKVSLAQALARASGLLDERADAGGVFLLRYEAGDIVKRLGMPGAPPNAPPPNAPPTPIVYHLDLGNIKSYLLAQSFPVRDKDIIYVANAQTNSIQKFFQLLATLSSPISTAIVVAR